MKKQRKNKHIANTRKYLNNTHINTIVNSLGIAAFKLARDARQYIGGAVAIVCLLVGGGVGSVTSGRPSFLSAGVAVKRAPVRRLPGVEAVLIVAR